MAHGDPVCPACRKHIAGKEEFCPHCGAELFPLLQAAALFEESLQKAAQALSERDPRSAFEWLRAAEIWRPNDRRAAALDALWAEYYAQLKDYDRAAQAAQRATLANRQQYETLKEAAERAREWASWSLHLLECGLYRSAEFALQKSRETGAPLLRIQALLRLVLDLKIHRLRALSAARKIVESALPDPFLKWLYREIHST